MNTSSHTSKHTPPRRPPVLPGSRGLPWLGLLACLILTVLAGVRLIALQSDNATIDALAARRDIVVPADARAEVAYARVRFLLDRDRLDEAVPLVEIIGRDAASEPRLARRQLAADAWRALGSARLRLAFSLMRDGKIDEAIPSVRLAKEFYIRALRLVPGDWDAKFNLDVASRLVRDFPEGNAQGEESPDPPKRVWTDLPGLPKGLP